ncbi:hypothetical protein RIR_jg18632.t1 [Rhizophagus irregularis DAOM 181602=DAOM 197198]|nr:hypothetical protein RIR_jg18632.t1 [Rhizophagus irregularis DAOM 181602=DAOM 197198]
MKKKKTKIKIKNRVNELVNYKFTKSLQIKIRPLRICDDAQRTFSRHKVCETSILNFVRQRLKNKTHNYIMLHM